MEKVNKFLYTKNALSIFAKSQKTNKVIKNSLENTVTSYGTGIQYTNVAI